MALPGLLAAFARLSDLSLCKAGPWRGYFLPAVLSYAAGLAATYCALLYSLFGDSGQPALLYLVRLGSRVRVRVRVSAPVGTGWYGCSSWTDVPGLEATHDIDWIFFKIMSR